jgi:hypothetical protein
MAILAERMIEFDFRVMKGVSAHHASFQQSRWSSEPLSVTSNVPGAWVDVTPLDDALNGGGFANFERHYPLTTMVTLTAEPTADGRPFVGWLVNGVIQSGTQSSGPSASSQQNPLGNVVEVTILENETVQAVYAKTFSPTTEPGAEQSGPGIGGRGD